MYVLLLDDFTMELNLSDDYQRNGIMAILFMVEMQLDPIDLLLHIHNHSIDVKAHSKEERCRRYHCYGVCSRREKLNHQLTKISNVGVRAKQ